jgi:hypothetical protein
VLINIGGPREKALHSDTLRATNSHRRAAETYLQRHTQAGRDWPVYAKYRAEESCRVRPRVRKLLKLHNANDLRYGRTELVWHNQDRYPRPIFWAFKPLGLGWRRGHVRCYGPVLSTYCDPRGGHAQSGASSLGHLRDDAKITSQILGPCRAGFAIEAVRESLQSTNFGLKGVRTQTMYLRLRSRSALLLAGATENFRS